MSANEQGPSFVNLGNARKDEQREVMEHIQHEGVCPFCPESIKKYHKQPILREGEHWLLTQNQWPYDFTEHHLLLIATKHIQTVTDLGPGSFDELQGHVEWAVATYRIASGGLAMRFGSIERNGATVDHLHAHIIEPAKDIPEDEKVRFKISR